MQVVLHAGFHKTGTTSFQNWLRENSAALEHSGFATFPLDHRVIASSPKIFDPQGLRADLRCAKNRGMKVAIFSHETLCQLYPRGLVKLYNVFDGFPVRYVITLRHWSSYLVSRWMQNAKRRDSQSYNSYLTDLLEKPEGRIDADFGLPITRAQAAGFSDFRILTYNPDPDQMLRSLARACDLPEPQVGCLLPKKNVSPSTHFSDQIRLFNGVRSVLHGSPLNPMAAGQPTIFYDQASVVRAFQKDRPSLASALDGLLSETTQTIDSDHPTFQVWNRILSQKIQPFLCIPSNGLIFSDNLNRALSVSSIEVKELPAALQEGMAAYLGTT